MNVYQGIANFERLNYGVVTSGTFDGVHIGHQKILKRLKEVTAASKDKKAESVVITFWPHPRLVLFPEQTDLKLLSTIEEKIDLMTQHTINHLIIIPFDKDFGKLSSEDFIQKILIEKINTKKLVIGYDHRFGRNREGGFDYLKANEHLYGFEVEEIPRQDIDDVGVSSTKIRNALLEGNMEIANEYLGSPYTLTGKVVKGQQIGREIGFSTANVEVSEKYKLIPEDGIYAVRVKSGTTIYKGMLYIGMRTTLGEDLARSIEVNIFDFNQNIYGTELTIYFVKQLRKEEKFNNLEAMKVQLGLDKRAALKVLKD